MREIKIVVFVVLFFSLVCKSSFGMDDARLMRWPDINGDKIVFVYGGDLWTVNLKGGTAVRLTSFAGSELQPKFSPDGKWIAFSGEYDGNIDIYIISSTGGEPKRLTWHPDFDLVSGWTPDSKNVVFYSRRGSFSYRYAQIYMISINGSCPEQLPFPMGAYTAFSPDGKCIAYTPLLNAFQTWRRYRGGMSNFIWVYNRFDNSVQKIPHSICSDTFPVWIGDEIYFLSDRDRVMNLYSYNMKNEILKQITKFEGADIKTYGADNNNIIFERDGYLNLMDIKSGKIEKLTVNIPNEGIFLRPHFTKAGRLINNFNISPSGQRAVFEARGEIVTVPAKKGDVRNLTNTTSAAERSPAWSPDSKWIAYFGEVDGEYTLKIIDQMGAEKPKTIKLNDTGYYFDLKWSPDSKMVSFIDHASHLFYLNLKTEKLVLVDQDPDYLNKPSANWSPDSKWLVYKKNGTNRLSSIYLYSVETGKHQQVTDEMSNAFSPVFDKSGKYLYFAVSTDSAFDLYPQFDTSSIPYQQTAGLYLIILAKNEPNPFKPESDEENIANDNNTNNEKDKEKSNLTRIDLDGIEDRIVPIGVSEKPYSNLNAGEAGKLFYLEFNRIDENSDLHVYNIKDRKDEITINGIDNYTLSADGKKILYQKNNYIWTIADAGTKPNPATENVLRTDAIETFSDPIAEYRQMLYESWRMYREYFYDPGMHGHDWNAIWKQYETYIPYIVHRSDLTYVIGMMIGELAVGHAFVGGGEYPKIEHIKGGLLGADYEISDGLYRIKKIYRGENWNPGLKSPLKEPSVNVNEGDYILEVNGKPVKRSDNIYSFFQKTASRQVVIRVNSKPSLIGSRSVIVVPIADEIPLRSKDWIESNRKKVLELSEGKVGYVYLPDTSDGGYTYFNRYYYSHIDKQAMVIDARFNNGGKTPDYYIEMIARPLMCWWRLRNGREWRSPQAQVYGPKAMLINEYAGSSGDVLPYGFRQRGLGKLIGKRTWGLVCGSNDYPSLMDGGWINVPFIGMMSLDNEFIIENHGVDPDIEIEITPADYIAGRDPQLEKAVQVLLDELKKNPPKEFKPGPYPRGR